MRHLPIAAAVLCLGAAHAAAPSGKRVKGRFTTDECVMSVSAKAASG
jgi:hypothetical protein